MAVAQEIKNSNTNDLSFESPSEACATFDDDTYDFPPDGFDEKPKIAEERGTDKSLDSDNDDDHAEPEVEFPFRAKRSASFRKAAFNSFKRSFITKNRAPVRCSNSAEESLVIVNDHVNSDVNEHDNGHVRGSARTNPINSVRSTDDHEHSLLSNGLPKKRMCSNPK